MAQRARRAGRCRAGAAVPAVPRPGVARSRARVCAPDRRSRPHQGARLARRAALPRHGRRAGRVACGRRAGGHAEGDRRPLRPVLEGVHPGHGRRRVRRARGRATASPLHDRHQRRRLRHEPAVRRCARHRAGRDGSGGLLRPGRGWNGRGEQEHDQDPRVGGRSLRAGLLRLRLEEVGLADGVAPALRPAADPRAVSRPAGELRRLPPLRVAGSRRRARPSGPRRHPAAQLLARTGRRVGRAVASGPGADPRQARRRVRDRRRPDRPRGRPGRAYQHRAADLLLRHLRRPAARAGDRPHQGGGRTDVRPARRRGGRAQPGCGRPGAGRAEPGRGSRSGRRRAAACRWSFPRTRPSSCAPSRRR